MSGPISTDDFEKLGATRFGEPLVKAILFYPDGRRAVIDLPFSPRQREVVLSHPQQRIMAVLVESPIPMTRKQIASKVDRDDLTGGFARDIRALKQFELITTRGQELSDDPNKFA